MTASSPYEKEQLRHNSPERKSIAPEFDYRTGTGSGEIQNQVTIKMFP
jgi:hypothetical protein